MRILLAAVFALVAQSAFAGKEDREFKTKEAEPAVAKAAAAYKTACGCDLSIKVAWDKFPTAADMRYIRNSAGSIADEVGKYCDTADTKKIMCSLKSMEMTKGEKTGFTFANGKGVATFDGHTSIGFQNITQVIDK